MGHGSGSLLGMKTSLLAAPTLALTAALGTLSYNAAAQSAQETAPSPGEIVGAAPASDWVTIPAEDLLVMTLSPDAKGQARTVVIQLMPAPFSQGWVENIRTLARAKWYDNISVNRVQDNYVTQWGDPNYDNPEATGKAKPLPKGLKVMAEADYVAPASEQLFPKVLTSFGIENFKDVYAPIKTSVTGHEPPRLADPYAHAFSFHKGFSIAMGMVPKEGRRPTSFGPDIAWPLHCYGMVGVGRGMSPDTGSGAELYTVIGHAPRHLDRNIALVGRVIEGMEHLSSLPRGKGDLGFYAADEVDKRTPILSVRVVSDLPAGEQPRFQYLSTDGEAFARYADARANRRDPFFIAPAGGADICNIPVPVRRVPAG